MSAPPEDPSGAPDALGATMDRALALARRGLGTTSPNPMVGAVVLRDGVVVGEGFHERAGGPHAEVGALTAAGERARGAALVVTLEPCCHRGGGKRTPPCIDAVIAAGIAKVVVAARDPNPRVDGGGVAALRAAGVEVVTGVREAEARALNVVFEHWVTTGRPYVRLKLAQTLDGRIASAPGRRDAITGAAAQARVHALRATSDAIMVGANTVRVDDPRLTVRGSAGPYLPPLRIAVASAPDRIPAHAAMLDPDAPGGALVLTPEPGATRVDLRAALTGLAKRSPRPITSLLVEGGATLAAALLADDLVDALILHVAPVVFGDRGVPAFAALDVPKRFTLTSTERLGDDLELVLHPTPARGLIVFTGIIQDVGTVESLVERRLTVATRLATGDLADLRIGDSIAVHGPCLTVVEHRPGRVAFELHPETVRRSTLGAARPGARVNLERALRLGDRLDGHLVQGHVDGVARLAAKARVAAGDYELALDLPDDLVPFVAPKGSIALDGVSLTVASIIGRRLTVAIIPHTATHTTLGELAVGASVNVETDILGRYVARLLGRDPAGGLSLDALARGGFLER